MVTVMRMVMVVTVMRMMVVVGAHNMQSLWTQDMGEVSTRNRPRFFVHVSYPGKPKNDRAPQNRTKHAKVLHMP